jgi:hypothetical protein
MTLLEENLMDRITQRNFDYKTNPRLGCHLGFDNSCPYPHCNSCPIKELYVRVQGLEDLEESDEVFLIGNEGSFESIELMKQSEQVVFSLEVNEICDFDLINSIGTELFLVKEEAESYLERLKDGFANGNDM